MANGQMKRCSTSLVTKEMQSKATKRYHLTHVRMAFISKSTGNEYWEDVEKREPSCAVFTDGCSHCGKQYEVTSNIENGTDLWPSDPISGYLSQETRNTDSKEKCTPKFIAALFIVAKVWKQPECPSVDEWLKICGTFPQWNTTQL